MLDPRLAFYLTHHSGYGDRWLRPSLAALCMGQASLTPCSRWLKQSHRIGTFRVYATFVTDKGQRDTYQYVKSGNGQIAHINGIMSELIYLSDTDENLNSVKFTWRFAENRPKVAVPESPGIFNDKFNPTFS